MPIDATEIDFERDVIERSKEVPVVVDFWADWCGPCKQLSPALEAAETKRDGEVVLAKVDVDSNQALAAQFGIQGIPAVKAFRDGQIVDEFTGAVPPPQVEAFFAGLAPSPAASNWSAREGATSSRCARRPNWSRAAPTS